MKAVCYHHVSFTKLLSLVLVSGWMCGNIFILERETLWCVFIRGGSERTDKSQPLSLVIRQVQVVITAFKNLQAFIIVLFSP